MSQTPTHRNAHLRPSYSSMTMMEMIDPTVPLIMRDLQLLDRPDEDYSVQSRSPLTDSQSTDDNCRGAVAAPAYFGPLVCVIMIMLFVGSVFWLAYW